MTKCGMPAPGGVKSKQPKSHILGPDQVCDADLLATLS